MTMVDEKRYAYLVIYLLHFVKGQLLGYNYSKSKIKINKIK